MSTSPDHVGETSRVSHAPLLELHLASTSVARWASVSPGTRQDRVSGWANGLRQFLVRAPDGDVINIVSHRTKTAQGLGLRLWSAQHCSNDWGT